MDDSKYHDLEYEQFVRESIKTNLLDDAVEIMLSQADLAIIHPDTLNFDSIIKINGKDWQIKAYQPKSQLFLLVRKDIVPASESRA